MSEAQEPSYFSVIPYPVLASQALRDKTKLVYGLIASLAEKDGYCWASNGKLARIMCCGERTISRAISELTEAGELVVRDVGDGEKLGNRERRIYTKETAVRSLAQIGSPAKMGEASHAKMGEAVFNRYDNKRPIPPIVPQVDETDERFDGFWIFYRDVVCKDDHARAGNKAAAKRAWAKLKPDKKLADRIAIYLAAQVKTEMWQRGYGIPYASTLLNRIFRKEVDLTPVEPSATHAPAASAYEEPREEAFGLWH